VPTQSSKSSSPSSSSSSSSSFTLTASPSPSSPSSTSSSPALSSVPRALDSNASKTAVATVASAASAAASVLVPPNINTDWHSHSNASQAHHMPAPQRPALFNQHTAAAAGAVSGSSYAAAFPLPFGASGSTNQTAHASQAQHSALLLQPMFQSQQQSMHQPQPQPLQQNQHQNQQQQLSHQQPQVAQQLQQQLQQLYRNSSSQQQNQQQQQMSINQFGLLAPFSGPGQTGSSSGDDSSAAINPMMQSVCMQTKSLRA
jgi:hypothetical protein